MNVVYNAEKRHNVKRANLDNYILHLFIKIDKLGYIGKYTGYIITDARGEPVTFKRALELILKLW